MPSTSFRNWRGWRSDALDDLQGAHPLVTGSRRGRRFARQQINQAYAVLLASQFQGFCRDLHTECVDHVITTLAPPPLLRAQIREGYVRGRQLERGNANPGGIGSDFGLFGINFWNQVKSRNPKRNEARQGLLEELNQWRNAIAHQDFRPGRLGGSTTLGLARVRRWRHACEGLASRFDEVMRTHLNTLTGVAPW